MADRKAWNDKVDNRWITIYINKLIKSLKL